jgi:hypothetical protein
VEDTVSFGETFDREFQVPTECYAAPKGPAELDGFSTIKNRMFQKVSSRMAQAIVVIMICALFGGMCRVVYKEAGMIAAIVAALIAGLAIGAMIWVGFLTRNSKDDSPMPTPQRWVLLGYFLILGIAFTYFLIVLATAEFPETPVTVQTANAANLVGVPDNPPTNTPVLRRIFPQSTLGSNPDLFLMLYGQNFTEKAMVRVNGVERAATFESKDWLKALLQQSDLAGASSLTVEVINPDSSGTTRTVTNSLRVSVTKPQVSINVLGWHPAVTRELQLLMLVLFAGALGSYVHAIRSLTDFIGNRTVVASWFWWYIARPFIGMAMAVIFYAVLRGGFLAGTPADAKVVNPFGVLTIGALVGMFADKAAQKLAEIFDTLFKADDTRRDKLTSPVVEKIDPDYVRPGLTPPPEVAISGTHLSNVEKVRVNQQDRVPRQVDDKRVTLVLTSTDVAQPGEITLALIDKSGTITSAGTFFVTDLDIVAPDPSVADTLPPATIKQNYTCPFHATGGSGPYEWELVTPISDLKVEKATGRLSGVPQTAGEFTVTVKVTDSKKASVSRTFKLKVNNESTSQ